MISIDVIDHPHQTNKIQNALNQVHQYKKKRKKEHVIVLFTINARNMAMKNSGTSVMLESYNKNSRIQLSELSIPYRLTKSNF
jgi:hypothetical protein